MSKQMKIRDWGIATMASLALMPIAAQADSGLMIAGGAYYGAVNENVDGDFDTDKIKVDDSSGAYTLGVGYRFNKWLAVDAGYWGLGEYTSDKIANGRDFTTDASAWTLGGMVSIPVWIIDIYGRAGAAWWETDNDFGKDDDTDPYYGVGVAFNIGSSLDIYGEWTRFDLNTDLDLLGVGIRWTF